MKLTLPLCEHHIPVFIANALVTAVEIVALVFVQTVQEKENASAVIHANVTLDVVKPLNA